jgi:integrase
MSLITNVFRRGAIYAFRIRVPEHLRDRVGRRELWRSLRTSLAGEARRRGVVLHNLTEALWHDLERVMDHRESKALIDEWLRSEIGEDTYLRERLDGEKYVGVVLRRERRSRPDTIVTTFDHEQLANHRAMSVRDQAAALGPNGYLREEIFDRDLTVEGQRKMFGIGGPPRSLDDDEVAIDHVRALFARNDIVVDEFSREFEVATKLMQRAQADLASVINDRDAIGWREFLGDDPAAEMLEKLNRAPIPDEGSPVAKAESLSLSEAAKRAIPELARIEGFRPKRIEDYENAVATLLDWFGRDPDVMEITPKMAGDFAVDLSHFPSNCRKRQPYRDLNSFADRLAAAAANGEANVLSPATVNGKYLTPIRRIFDWLGGKGFAVTNPLTEIKVRKPKRADPRKKRRPFTNKEVVRLFALPLFVGAAASSGKLLYKPGSILVSGWRFWVPLICLYTGMRLNEVCGLAVADIKEEDGIPYFHVRDELLNQSVKSDAGRRKVPLSDALILVGLLDFVAEMRSAGRERLFEELQPDPDGYFSTAPSKFLNDLVRRIKDADPDDPGKLVFHSTRHTVVSRLRSAGVRQDVSMSIVGHEAGEVHAGYGDCDIPALKAAVNKISYLGLDISTIRQLASPL